METSLFVLKEFLVMVKFFAVLFMVLGMSCVGVAQTYQEAFDSLSAASTTADDAGNAAYNEEGVAVNQKQAAVNNLINLLLNNNPNSSICSSYIDEGNAKLGEGNTLFTSGSAYFTAAADAFAAMATEGSTGDWYPHYLSALADFDLATADFQMAKTRYTSAKNKYIQAQNVY